MRITVGKVILRCLLGDIVAQPTDAIVNTANSELMPGGGVAGSIHRAAGPELAIACEPLAPIAVGEAVITPGFNLHNSFVIHCLGPVYGRDEPSDQLLASCYLNSLELAEKAELNSIAFPAISTGVFGYPIEEAADIAIRTVTEQVPRLEHLALVRFVLWDDETYSAFSERLARAAALGAG